MKLRILPLSAGVHWIRQAFATFRQKPLVFVALAAFCFFITSLLSRIPTLGVLIALMGHILFCLAFMLGAQEISEGRAPSLGEIINRIVKAPGGIRPLLVLSFLYMVALFGFILLTSSTITLFVTPETLAKVNEILTQLQNPNAVMKESDLMLLARHYMLLAGLSLLAYIITLLFFYFTPALVYWGQISPVKAIFFNLIACLKNATTFLVYGLAWLVVLVAGATALIMVTSVVVSMLGGNTPGLMLMSFMGLLYMLSTFALFQISVYYAFKGCFDTAQQHRE